MSAEQTIQSVSISAYEQIDGAFSVSQISQSVTGVLYEEISGTISLSQAVQSVDIDAYFKNQSTFQAKQSIISGAYLQINATGSASQAIQSVDIDTLYLNVAGIVSVTQAAQTVSASAFVGLSAQVSVMQSTQYMSSFGNSVVVTPPLPSVVMVKDRILRNIRNSGSR